MNKPTPRQLLVDRLDAMRKQGMKWLDISKEVENVPAGTLNRIYNHADYEPRRPEIRAKLGLPVLGLAPVCADCGDVHVARHPRRRPNFEERCAAWDKWQAEHAGEVTAIVAALT